MKQGERAMARGDRESRKMGENEVCQRMWDTVHRQDEAEETERRSGIPGASPEEVGEDETHRII